MSEHGAGEQGHAAGLWPVPGDGVLARHSDLILLSSLDDGQFVDVLLDLLEEFAESGGYGRRFADAIADALEAGPPSGAAAAAEAGEPGPEPSVLAFGPAGPSGGLAVTVSGGAWAEVTTAQGTARLEASHPGMLLRSVLRTPVSSIRGGLSPADNGAASTDRFSRLDAGTVRAGGLSYFSAGGAGTGQARAAGSAGMTGAPAGGPAQKASAAKVPAQAKAVPAAEPVAPPAPAEPEAAEPEAAAEPPGAAEPQAAAEPGAPQAGQAGQAEQAGPGDMPPEPPPAGVPFEPTAAWQAPEAPEGAAQPQSTELWNMEQELGDHGGGGPAVDMLKAGAAPAEEAEREVTEPPPAPFEAAGPYPPAEPYPSAESFPAAEPYQSGEPFEAVLLAPGSGIDSPPRQPLPQVRDLPPGTSSYVSQGPIIQGVYCKNGHFDDPEALFCAICGISMNQQTLVPRPGERPPLGVLLLDDGSVFQLDHDYVVGREPSLDGSVAAGKARPLRVTDDSGIVSRVHARVHLEGWRVLVTDLGSANGTRVHLPNQPTEQQLVPQVPVVLATGSQVDLGGRVFRYESHRGR